MNGTPTLLIIEQHYAAPIAYLFKGRLLCYIMYHFGGKYICVCVCSLLKGHCTFLCKSMCMCVFK